MEQHYVAAAFTTATGGLTAWDPSAEEGSEHRRPSPAHACLWAALSPCSTACPATTLRRSAADGSVDPSWNPDVNGIVYALAASDDGNTIFLGGAFTTAGSSARSRLRRR